MRKIFVRGLLLAGLLLSVCAAQAQYGASTQRPPDAGSAASQQTQNAPSAAPQQPFGTTAAGYGSNTNATTGQISPNEIRLSGCLRPGSTAYEYALVGGGGNVYELNSQGVALGTHVEKVVEVAGVKNDDDTITVTSLNVVSNACSNY